MLEPSIHFTPIRLTSYQRNEVEMEVGVQNGGPQPLWIECDVKVPSAISLAPDRVLEGGRTRMGIALAGHSVSKKVKIYGGAASYPDDYKISLTFYAYGQDGTIAQRIDHHERLRCVKFGDE